MISSVGIGEDHLTGTKEVRSCVILVFSFEVQIAIKKKKKKRDVILSDSLTQKLHLVAC